MKRQYIVQVVYSSLFACCFIGFLYYTKQHSENRDDAKLEEIRVLISDTPVYPDFIKLDENYTSRRVDAGVSQYFRSNTNFQTVKSFYISTLTRVGWEPDKNGSELSFHKEGIDLHIEFRSGKDVDWNYGLSYVWRDKKQFLVK